MFKLPAKPKLLNTQQRHLCKSRPDALSKLPSAMGREVAKWLKRKRESQQSPEGTGLAGAGCYG